MTNNGKCAIIKSTNEGEPQRKKGLEKMNYYGKITFEICGNRPMWENLDNEKLTKTREFEDLYRDKHNIYSNDYMCELIREDLLLTAGGENYFNTICNVDIKIYKTMAKSLNEYKKTVESVTADLSKEINKNKLERDLNAIIDNFLN